MDLFLGNLNYKVTEEEIRDLFKPFGTIGKVNIVKDRETKKPRGIAFVAIENEGYAAAAVTELNDKPFLGRNLVIRPAYDKKSNS